MIGWSVDIYRIHDGYIIIVVASLWRRLIASENAEIVRWPVTGKDGDTDGIADAFAGGIAHCHSGERS